VKITGDGLAYLYCSYEYERANSTWL